jgi:hypothetical protein
LESVADRRTSAPTRTLAAARTHLGVIIAASPSPVVLVDSSEPGRALALLI